MSCNDFLYLILQIRSVMEESLIQSGSEAITTDNFRPEHVESLTQQFQEAHVPFPRARNFYQTSVYREEFDKFNMALLDYELTLRNLEEEIVASPDLHPSNVLQIILEVLENIFHVLRRYAPVDTFIRFVLQQVTRCYVPCT